MMRWVKRLKTAIRILVNSKEADLYDAWARYLNMSKYAEEIYKRAPSSDKLEPADLITMSRYHEARKQYVDAYQALNPGIDPPSIL